MIHFESVTKLYGSVIGVNDISLTLEPGAYGLLGPNGSGKSTLLNLITGQLRPTLGQVRVFGESPVHNAELFRRLGFCPSSEGLYADVSGLQWLRYLLELWGMPARQAATTAEATLVQIGLSEAMRRPMATYSRGMRQRVKLAQAIAHEPEFLILDEPFSGLDPIGRNQMTVLLKSWISQGRSLLLASHVLHEIETIAPNFLLICGGRLLAAGSANDIQELLVDVPNRVTIRCSDPKRLAAVLLEIDIGESFTIDGDQLTVATQNPGRLFAELPTRLAESQIQVAEMHSADESLQALFHSLLRIHRGEM